MAFKTREQIEAEASDRAARMVDQAEADLAKRVEGGRKRVFGVLESRPEERFVGSDKIIRFRVTEPNRDKPMSGVMFAAPHETRDGFAQDEFDKRLEALQAGDKVSLAGAWSKRKWNDRAGNAHEEWEFKTTFFAPGDVSIADMALAERARIGDARLETLPYGEEIAASQADIPRGAATRPIASPTLSYATGNIVDDQAQVLVNTVNSQLSEHGNPVMGKGVALAFKERFPSIMKDYGDAIKSGELKPGRAMLFDLPDGRKWAALATKDHFRDPSQEAWVESGLKELAEKMRAAGLTSVALPPPGCGNGGLDWKRVEPMVHQHLATDGIAVSMYAKPSGAMEPSVERAGFQQTNRDVSSAGKFGDSPRDVPSGRAKTLAAFGGDDRASASEIGREWTKDDILKAIPTLLRNGDAGYSPYAGIGSRETPQDVSDDMTAAAKVLESRNFTLRSGFAGGADTAFELGTKRDDLREIFAPWKGFGANPDSPHEKKRWDQIRRHEQITGEKFTPAKATLLEGEMFRKAEALAKPHHPTWDRLGDGPRKMHTRNMGQVFGPKLDVPARFEMAYTVDGKASGGTGQAIRTAQSVGIPVLNMHDRDIRDAVLKELGIGREHERDRSIETQAVQKASAPKQVEVASDKVPGEFDLSVPSVRARGKHQVAYFCKVADPLGSLSNMYGKAPLVVNGVRWGSSEALYQAMRFEDPALQEKVRREPTAYSSKIVAHENKQHTRADWDQVNVAAMAYVITVKKDQSQAFRDDLASTQGKDIVELSVKDGFWGAQPRGADLVGRDVLGSLLTQSRDGARMDEPPAGIVLLGADVAASVAKETSQSLPEPALRASMYFEFNGQKRPEVKSESTFQAILAGERTATTRFPEWGALDRYEDLKPGQVVRFYEDRAMKGERIDVVVTGVERVDLSKASPAKIEQWSKAEGWSEEAARDFGRKHREGVQIHYALPESPEGAAALGRDVAPAREQAPSRTVARDAAPEADRRPSASQLAAMTAKQRTLAFF